MREARRKSPQHRQPARKVIGEVLKKRDRERDPKKEGGCRDKRCSPIRVYIGFLGFEVRHLPMLTYLTSLSASLLKPPLQSRISTYLCTQQSLRYSLGRQKFLIFCCVSCKEESISATRTALKWGKLDH